MAELAAGASSAMLILGGAAAARRESAASVQERCRVVAIGPVAPAMLQDCCGVHREDADDDDGPNRERVNAVTGVVEDPVAARPTASITEDEHRMVGGGWFTTGGAVAVACVEARRFWSAWRVSLPRDVLARSHTAPCYAIHEHSLLQLNISYSCHRPLMSLRGYRTKKNF